PAPARQRPLRGTPRWLQPAGGARVRSPAGVASAHGHPPGGRRASWDASSGRSLASTQTFGRASSRAERHEEPHMRWKIISVNSAILSVVALLAFVLLKVSLDGVLADRAARRSDAERALRSANIQLELEGLRLQRWLAARTTEEAVLRVFAGGTSQARSETA